MLVLQRDIKVKIPACHELIVGELSLSRLRSISGSRSERGTHPPSSSSPSTPAANWVIIQMRLRDCRRRSLLGFDWLCFAVEDCSSNPSWKAAKDHADSDDDLTRLLSSVYEWFRQRVSRHESDAEFGGQLLVGDTLGLLTCGRRSANIGLIF